MGAHYTTSAVKPSTPTASVVPTPPVVTNDSVPLDPPIYDQIHPLSVTPLNFAKLQHQYSAYVGQKERRKLSADGLQTLLTDPVIRACPTMSAMVQELRGVDAWEMVLGQLYTANSTSPRIEYILATLGYGVAYAPCSAEMEPLIAPVLAARARQECSPDCLYQPCEWVVLTSDQADTIRTESFDRIAAQLEHARERRKIIKAARMRVGAELQTMLREGRARRELVDAATIGRRSGGMRAYLEECWSDEDEDLTPLPSLAPGQRPCFA